MGRFRLLLVLLLMPLYALSWQNTASPQPQPGPAAPPPGGTNRHITLDVQVTDRFGAPIRGLQRQDFTLLDNKQAQSILSFHAVDSRTAAATDPPVEIVLIVNAINASSKAFAYEREGVQKFLLQNSSKLAQPLSLIIVPDAATANRAYDAVGRTNLSLKTVKSLAAFEGKRPGRKLMISISPGWPLLNGPNTQLSSKDERQIFHSIVVASTKLRQARITLYSVDPIGVVESAETRTTYYENLLKGVTSASQAVPGDLGLQVLAIQSGGSVFNSSNDLTTAIANAVADADAFYVLSFDSLAAGHANEYHSLQVTVNKPGMTARTRTGYYNQP